MLFALFGFLFAPPLSAQSPTREAYVAQSADKSTLTFYYDAQRANRSSKTWGIQDVVKGKYGENVPAWTVYDTLTVDSTRRVVLDASFGDFRPTTTRLWFADLGAVTQIEGLKHLNTEKVTDMTGMFVDCSGLTTLDLSSFNTGNVTDMTGMFYGCTNLTSLNLLNFNTKKVRDMRSMFSYCLFLTSLDLSQFDTENVTRMDGMFRSCIRLTNLDLQSFSTENVTTMLQMFYRCYSLRSLNLQSFNTEKVTDMYEMFSECTDLSSLNLSNFNTEKVTSMERMFQGCSALTKIHCKTTWSNKNSRDMFGGCENLKGVVAYDSLRVDATMANPETGYFTKRIPGETEAYVAQSADKTTLTFYYDAQRDSRTEHTWDIADVKKDRESRVFPAWAAFDGENGSTTTRVVFDASFRDARPQNTVRWFANLSKLTQIEGLENLNTEKVTNMSGMFAGCSRLTSLDLQPFNTKKVTNMAEMFAGCSSLTSLNISSFNTANVTDMSLMFVSCSGLTSLNVTNFNTAKVTDMLGMFGECSGLTSLNVTNFNTANVENMRAMFGKCSGLTSLDVSKFNTDKVSNMGWMFYECSGLTSLDLRNFNTANVNIMTSMFENCSNLATIYSNRIWQNVSSEKMFAGCEKLQGAVAYDASKTDATMASPSTGYFKLKSLGVPEAYVVQSEDKAGLTFYYDKERTSRVGVTWSIDDTKRVDDTVVPMWINGVETKDTIITRLVLDASFRDFRPITTRLWFANLAALTQIEGLEYLNTENVTNMSGMFYGCSGLTSLDLRNFNTQNVISMGGLFSGCTGLSSLDLQHFNTEKVVSMGSMFSGCTGLSSLDLQHFNTEKVINMGSMFSGCTGLNSLDLQHFNTEKVINMGSMFSRCIGLRTLNLKNFTTVDNPQIGSMFEGCSNLTTIYCDGNWRSNSSSNMFSGCTKLQGAVAYDATKIDVSMANPDMGYFTLVTPRGVEAYVAQSADETTLTFYYDAQRATRSGKTWGINETGMDSKIDFVPAWVVSDAVHRKMTKVVFDASFQDFSPTHTKRWFYNCHALKQIDGLEYLNTENVTDMLEMFRNCNALTSLDVSQFNTGNVRRMNWMFAGCSSLTSLDLRNFNTKKVTGMRSMFSECSSLTSLDLTNFSTDSVTTMRGMFDSCSGLTSLDLSKFNTQNVTSMREMFDGCSGLTSLDLNNFNTQNVTNMNSMFSRCSRLASISLKSFKTEKVTDMTQMFAGCLRLTALDLQHFKTDSIQELVGMFKDCSGLTSLDLSNFSTKNAPDMEKMFFNCSNLTKIYSETAWISGNSYEMFGGCLKVKGAVAYDAIQTDVTMANPTTGYFTAKPSALVRLREGEAGAQSIYTLQGKRVHEAWQHLPAGVYVVNGKRVIK